MLTPINSDNRTVNGYKAVPAHHNLIIFIGQQSSRRRTRLWCSVISRRIRVFIASMEYANKDLANIKNLFLNTMEGFGNQLTHPRSMFNLRYINVVMHRDAALSDLLTSYGVAQKRLEEFAILNGRYAKLTDIVPAGKMFKVAQKGKAWFLLLARCLNLWNLYIPLANGIIMSDVLGTVLVF